MKESKENIFTIFDDILQREDKESLLQQKSKVIWMTGLSGSGKTTIAKGVERYLHNNGILNQLLDGDNIRVGISNNLTFSSEDRSENIRRIAEVSKLFLNCGIVTLNCFVSPTIKIREIAKEIIGVENFIEIYINASIETCENCYNQTNIIKNLSIYPKNMRKNLNITNGIFFSQRVLLELTNLGLSREEAYKIVQKNAMKSWNNNSSFYENVAKDKQVTNKIPVNKLKKLFNFSYHTKRINIIFNRSLKKN